ncbi:alpha-hydroxy acid oxidase [Kribbella sp. CA-293567]|uniref:alpha-hydroxy acid oxidase n=1 Tax=Kribbella sp. CA-293567 TaxID=3002436 RepID=UPI0022DDD963|nr:alpha-hydroxy acid oxidase [Kribbella sp. CA-293567]WBQ06331.1 alpha-hydroxy acid oxidase [Kribbella sp. CA-293567]
MRWIDGLEAAAAEKLPEAVYRYFRQGSAGGISAAEATAAWSSYRLRPRVLTDVSTVDISTTVLGTPVAVPVLVAPTTLQRQADPGGEAAMAAGVAAAGSVLGVSSNAGTAFADLGATGAPWWLQIYVVKNREVTLRMLDAAVAAGARAVVLTADTPVVGRKEDDGPTVWEVIRPGDLLANLDPGEYTDADLAKADDLTPDVIGWLAERTGLPVLVKGVLRGDDAKRCSEAGAAGVIVSNHGGRQLDGAISTAQALPEVAAALAGTSTELYIDGGIRRGEHVLTALALGARAVLLGRPALYALSVGGAAGVTRLLTELGAELEHAMRLVGSPTLADLTPDLLSR